MLALIGSDIPARDFLIAFRSLAVVGRTMPVPDVTPGHDHGWGIVAVPFSFSGLLKEYGVGSADSDVEFERFAGKIGDRFSGIIMAHLRKATGFKRSIDNCHPFVGGGRIFMHNGGIPAMYEPDRSDTRAWFEDIISKLDGPVDKVLMKSVAWIKEEGGYSSLTSVLCSEEGLCAVREFNEDKFKDYFTLCFAKMDDFVVISQEKEFLGDLVESDRWVDVENHQVVKAGMDLGVELKGISGKMRSVRRT